MFITSNGAQSTGLYSTYWKPMDINSATSAAYGNNGTLSPANLCTYWDPTTPYTVIPSNNTYLTLVASVLSSCRSTCTQSTNSKCSSANLKTYFIGNGVKLAFCTDVHLVIYSSQVPSWGSN